MYEFNYISAANSTIKEIQESREQLLNKLKELIGDRLPGKRGRKPKRALEKLDPYESDRMQVYIDLYNYVKNGFNVIIEVDKLKNEEIKLKHIESLIKKARSMNLPLNVFVSGYSQFGKEKDHVDMLFNKKTMGTFIALNSYLETNNCSPLRFMEDPMKPENSWTIDQVAIANEQIDSIVDYIKLQKFSPFEAIAYIHYYITSQFPYKENVDNAVSPRSIVGLLNTEDIVCVGYAKFVKAIIDKLGYGKNLSAQTIECVIKPIESDGKVKIINKFPLDGFAHEQNLITIKDEKYSLDGTYVNDACWDTMDKEFEYGKGFGNFMYTVNDALNYEGFTYQQANEEDYFDATRILESDYIQKPNENPFIAKYSKKSNQIPLATYENCLYNMFKKMYPGISATQLKETVNFYLLSSKLVAASVFSKDAQSEFAKEGRILQEQLEQNVEQKEIMK